MEVLPVSVVRANKIPYSYLATVDRVNFVIIKCCGIKIRGVFIECEGDL